MDLIRQRGPLDCGVAVAAMLAQSDYDSAYVAASYQAIHRGLFVKDMIDCLRKMGHSSWSISKRGYKKSLISYTAILKSRHGLIIRQPQDTFGHWIARQDHIIFDPEFPTPCDVSQYDKRGWEIIRMLIPI